MATQENIMTHTYDFLLYIVPQLSKYPRAQKFLLADRIQNYSLELLELLVEAYYSDKATKKPLLKKANILLEKMRFLVRLSKDLKCIDLHRYEVISKKINEIGQQLGAWLKTV
jgi:hypothetical protein